MAERRSLIEAYIDETELVIGGRKSLLYGAIVPTALSDALEALVQLKVDHALPADFELKWSSKGGDPRLKAVLKEATISIVGRAFVAVFVLWASRDKDDVFLRTANLIRKVAQEHGASYVNIIYDGDAVRTPRRITQTLASWNSPKCTLLASAESSVSLPIQLADLAVGALRYKVLTELGELSRKTVSFEWEVGHCEDLPLAEVFSILLRWMIPGVTPNPVTAEPGTLFKRCLGVGVVADDAFSPAELEAIGQACTFYVGCMS